MVARGQKMFACGMRKGARFWFKELIDHRPRPSPLGGTSVRSAVWPNVVGSISASAARPMVGWLAAAAMGRLGVVGTIKAQAGF